MGLIDEATERGYETLQPVLEQSLEQIGQVQTLTFFRYTKIVLPLDGYVFWFKSGQLRATGVLHYGSEQRQEEDQNIGVNPVTFTTSVEITDFNDIESDTLFVGHYQPPSASDGSAPNPLRFAFNQRGPLQRQAGLYHYVGQTLYASMASQLIDNPARIDQNKVIVSNSLPAWLALKSYSPPWLLPPNPGITLYPSFLVPDNKQLPYGAVHIEPDSIEALQSAPYLDRSGSHWQLTCERVIVTLYGCDNDVAMNFVDLVANYSRDTNAFGMMSMLPAPRDQKMTQTEFTILAQKKTLDFQISYNQRTIRQLARQLIESAKTTVGLMAPRVLDDYLPYALDISQSLGPSLQHQ